MNYYIYIIFFGLIIIFIIYPACIEIFNQIKPLLRNQKKTWQELQNKLNELTLTNISSLPDPTRSVLNLVLTDRAGRGKTQAIPAALNYLAMAVDVPLQALRSRSYLSVLLGLLGTVAVLALAFRDVQDIKNVKPDILSHIYLVNFIAICLAAVIYALFIHFRHEGDDLLLLASQALARLRAEVPEGVDPHLVAALEEVGRSFTQWGEDIYFRHQQHSERLVQEMRSLGEALREMIQGTLAAQKTEVEGIIPLLRTQDERLELLSQRLDERFQDLAKPLLAALPVLEAWRERTEELRQVILTVRQADLEGKTQSLAQATSALGTAVSGLPPAIRQHFQGIREELARALAQGVQQTWQQVMAPTFDQLHVRLGNLQEVHQGLKMSVGSLPARMAQEVAESTKRVWQETLQPVISPLAEAVSRLKDMHEALQEIHEGLVTEVRQALLTGFQPVNTYVKNLTETISRWSNKSEEVSAALEGKVQEIPTKISGELARTLEVIWQNDQRQSEALLNHLQALIEEQRNQHHQLEKITTLLPVSIENFFVRIQENLTQYLKTLMSGNENGYLQEMGESLKTIQSHLEKIQPGLTATERSQNPE